MHKILSNIRFFLVLLVMSTNVFGRQFVTPIIDLSEYERKIYSQNGEDGVIEKIFEIIGTTSEYYVEFGVGDCHECNTRYLRQHLGWQGLMMDCNYHNSLINLQREFIDVDISPIQKVELI